MLTHPAVIGPIVIVSYMNQWSALTRSGILTSGYGEPDKSWVYYSISRLLS